MSLQTILQKLVDNADASFPRPVKIDPPLQGGLNINLRKLSIEKQGNPPPKYILTLWRKNVHPSICEWNIVISHLPFQSPVIQPEKKRAGGRFYLQAII